MTQDVEQSSIRELSLDEAAAVGGGFSLTGLAHSVGYAAGTAVRDVEHAAGSVVRGAEHAAGAAVSGFRDGYRA
jgi:hypothetical protein